MRTAAFLLVLAIGGFGQPDAFVLADELAPTSEQRNWWAFRPVEHVEPPIAFDRDESLTEIDRFIRVELKNRGLSPAPRADKRTLLRRLKYGLIGLPTTPQEIDAFVRDDSPRAFQRVVDRLLASQHFGEHWGRHWLDVVRYADYLSPQADNIEGPGAENFDVEFYEAYRYRDWVVAALNRDMPYDDFVIHQLAGDQLAGETGGEIYADGLVATTVLSIGVWDNADADKNKVISDIVDDQINLVGKAFLGMTLACARCHDHKFEPISQEDYYGLAGIFYSTRILKNTGPVGLHTNALRVPLATADYVSQRTAQLARIEQIEQQLTPEGQAGDAGAPPTTSAALSDGEKKELNQELQKLQQELLPAPPTAMAALDEVTPGGLFPDLGDVPLHRAGRYDNLGARVSRRMPVFFRGLDQPEITVGSGRWELAQWISSADNPLTARVMVNRVWQHLFGEGLVRTPDNLGLSGEAPSHPELLDWLTRKFIEDGWSVKRLIRTIVCSAAYQQESAPAEPADPDNRWLGRFSPRRLQAEEIRDSILCASGQLDAKMGGAATADLKRPRRSLYVQTVRGDRRNYSTLLDAADPDQCVSKRYESSTAPQALFFLNDAFVQEQSYKLGRRLTAEASSDDRMRVQRAYELLFAREATDQEIAVGLEFVARATQRDPDLAWSDYAHLLLCSNEFCFVE
jgi:hypothetical protein